MDLTVNFSKFKGVKRTSLGLRNLLPCRKATGSAVFSSSAAGCYWAELRFFLQTRGSSPAFFPPAPPILASSSFACSGFLVRPDAWEAQGSDELDG
ncbi:hypothetical protein SLEP1_g50128 [Rubroshorea leprosula]|uniref:Uncharacterized protein n=1 Tax=Rubroshorea leprosula TaxID=152421 RepID=A0AAV5LYZ4_9ROSI|nr:hypothetical protein SLEP1_g50128 [Rubroshorea leprosula]